LSRFREDWLPAFDLVHEVWVASRFVRDALGAVSPVPVVCLPPSVTLPEPLDVGREHFGLPADRFVFLFVFDLSSQFERKNPLGLIRAFRRAGIEREALLALKFTHPERDSDAVRAMHEAADGLPVRFLEGHVTRAELAALLRASDGYASLHRSEGFGLTLAEAMLLDKPVVATGYSGNLEFMTDDTAWLVRHQLVALTRTHGPYLQGYEWAAPDEAHAAAHLREVALSPHSAAVRAREGGARARRLLSPEASGARLVERLSAIREDPRRRPSSRTPEECAVPS
jgi:glycosyltransferase involved in cell wall biosynthesis